MSAIGSVIVMVLVSSLFCGFPAVGDRGTCSGGCYQLDLVTSGSSPRWAISLRQMRHRPNLRYTAFGRPQRWQRVYPRTANLGLRAALTFSAVFAISVAPLSARQRGSRAA